jgi:hypothetical protein
MNRLINEIVTHTKYRRLRRLAEEPQMLIETGCLKMRYAGTNYECIDIEHEHHRVNGCWVLQAGLTLHSVIIVLGFIFVLIFVIFNFDFCCFDGSVAKKWVALMNGLIS